MGVSGIRVRRSRKIEITQMKPNLMYEQMERIANLMRASVRKSGLSKGLQPVQMEALHYLSRCNEYSNTPMAVAEFLGLTKGTVSQTLAVLEGDGLVTKTADAKDRRVIHLKLTPEGKTALSNAIPPEALTSALDQLSPTERQALNAALTTLWGSLQRVNGLKTFGVCASCRYHNRTEDGKSSCELTREVLLEAEHEKICREHLPRVQ
jgi:DNA-binding MarR family transcriptional regulator